MPRRRRVRPHVELTLEQLLELRIGTGGIPPIGEEYGHPRHLGECTVFRCGESAFGSEEERQAAYWAHREELVDPDEDACGQRAFAWWQYEAPSVCSHAPPCERPSVAHGGPARAAWLAHHRVLGPAETAFILSWDDGGPGVHAEIARAVRDVLDEQRA